MESRIQNLVRRRQYRITLHARVEMDADWVTTQDLVDAVLSPECAVIEDYPEDRRGHSHLLLGWTREDEPVHICCAIHEDVVIVITVYRPDETVWTEDWRRRR